MTIEQLLRDLLLAEVFSQKKWSSPLRLTASSALIYHLPHRTIIGRAVVVSRLIIFFVVAFLILYQQYVTFGVFFQLKDALHHEAFAMSAAALGIGILIGVSLSSGNKK